MDALAPRRREPYVKEPAKSDSVDPDFQEVPPRTTSRIASPKPKITTLPSHSLSSKS